MTFPGPRYTNQDTRKPVAVFGVPRLARPSRLNGAGIGLEFGFPSSLASASNAAETQPTPIPAGETISRTPAIRTIPLARNLRFEPRSDITAQELEQLGPYLKGKPLLPEDEQALGPAMRHLREVK